MNQKQVKTLRYLFGRLPSFPIGDARRRTAWQHFKLAFNKQPRNKRHSYLDNLYSQVVQLRNLTQQDAPNPSVS